jgi:hypothetical protein
MLQLLLFDEIYDFFLKKKRLRAARVHPARPAVLEYRHTNF